MKRWTVLLPMLCFTVFMVGHESYAATLPGHITALPNPPGAPQRDIFLITLPHPAMVPRDVTVRLRASDGKLTETHLAVKTIPNDKRQYEADWLATQTGHAQVSVYTNSHQLLAQATYKVARAKPHVFGRVIVGALFIGASLWFWWRQQRMVRQHR